MKLIDRYIAKEMIVPFITGTFIMVLLFQANAYIFIAKQFNVENIPLVARFQWIMYRTPGFMELSLPAGMSLAASLAVTRLQRESELTAFRAAGCRIMRVLVPVFLVGLFASVANFYIVESVVPIASRKAEELERKNAYLGLTANIRSNALLQLGEYAASLGTVIRDPSTESLTITDPLLIERPTPDRKYLVTAKSGKYVNGIWTFKDALAYNIEGGDLTTMKVIGQMKINQEINLDQFFNSDQTGFSYEEQTTPVLRKTILDALKAHIDARPAIVELNNRYAVPISCTVFAITSCVFSIFFAKSGGFVGILVSFFVVMLYYNVWVISTSILGKVESVPPWLAAWLPNIVFAALGLFAIRKLE